MRLGINNMHSRIRRGEDSPTRALYLVNLSELRGLARYPSAGKTREDALREVCKARAFWHGDRYSQPASEGARAALRVIESRIRGNGDPLAMLERVRPLVPANHFRTFVELRSSMSHYFNRTPAPLPGAKGAKQ